MTSIEHAAAGLHPSSLPLLVSADAVAVTVARDDRASTPVNVAGDLAAGLQVVVVLLAVAPVLLPTDRSQATSTLTLCLVGQDGPR